MKRKFNFWLSVFCQKITFSYLRALQFPYPSKFTQFNCSLRDFICYTLKLIHFIFSWKYFLVKSVWKVRLPENYSIGAKWSDQIYLASSQKKTTIADLIWPRFLSKWKFSTQKFWPQNCLLHPFYWIGFFTLQ